MRLRSLPVRCHYLNAAYVMQRRTFCSELFSSSRLLSMNDKDLSKSLRKSGETETLFSELHAIRQQSGALGLPKRLISLLEKSSLVFTTKEELLDISEAVQLMEHVLFTLIHIEASPASCHVVYNALRQYNCQNLALKPHPRTPHNDANNSDIKPPLKKSLFQPKGIHFCFAQYLFHFSTKEKDNSVLPLALTVLLIHAPKDGSISSHRPSFLALTLQILNRWNAYTLGENINSLKPDHQCHHRPSERLRCTAPLKDVDVTSPHAPSSPLTLRLIRWLSEGSDDQASGSTTPLHPQSSSLEGVALSAFLRLASHRPVPWSTIFTGIANYLGIISLEHAAYHSLFFSSLSASHLQSGNAKSSLGVRASLWEEEVVGEKLYHERKKTLQRRLQIIPSTNNSLVSVAIHYANFITSLNENFLNCFSKNDRNGISEHVCNRAADKIKNAMFKPIILNGDCIDLVDISDRIPEVETTLATWMTHIFMESLVVARDTSLEEWKAHSETVTNALQHLLLMFTSMPERMRAPPMVEQELWFFVLEGVHRGLFPAKGVQKEYTVMSKSELPNEKLLLRGRTPSTELLRNVGDSSDVLLRVVCPLYNSRYWHPPTVNLFISILHDQGRSTNIKEVFVSVQEEERVAQLAAQSSVVHSIKSTPPMPLSPNESSSSVPQTVYVPGLTFTSCSVVLKHCCYYLGDPFTAKDVLRYMLVKMLIEEKDEGKQQGQKSGRSFNQELVHTFEDPSSETSRWRSWIDQEGIPAIERAIRTSKADLPHDWIWS